jgi:ACT domain-containing protein
VSDEVGQGATLVSDQVEGLTRATVAAEEEGVCVTRDQLYRSTDTTYTTYTTDITDITDTIDTIDITDTTDTTDITDLTDVWCPA